MTPGRVTREPPDRWHVYRFALFRVRRAFFARDRHGRRANVLFGGLLSLALIGAAEAQTPPTRVRGVIDSASGTELIVKSREGREEKIVLLDTARVASVANASLSDIKAGMFVGTAAMPAEGGSLRALEVLIFPEALRGTGEGHRPWDLLPESTMTNATVANTSDKVDGPVLNLTYNGGNKSVVVPPEAPIVTLAPADRSDLKPGARVVVTTTKAADGTLTATSVVVGKNGVDPPM